MTVVLKTALPQYARGPLRAFLVSLVLTLVLAASANGSAAEELSGRIVRVADGDTITVLDAARVQHRIRLAGIDAPERGQSYGARAKDHMSSLVGGHQVVVAWQKRDRYGRIVGKVMLATWPWVSVLCPVRHSPS